MPSSHAESILRSSKELSEPIHITGTTASVRALLVARYAHLVHRDRRKIDPIIVLCPDDDRVAELCNDIECLSPILEQTEINACQFPTWDQSPYSPIQPSLKTRIARLSCLSSLVSNRSPDIVVTTLAAACQSTIPEEVFKSRLVVLQVGQSIGSREELILKLVESGYLRVDPVEDRGTFAVRGEIIDIFPVDREKPIRIELFDDEIEKIREFDATSQRTLAQVEIKEANVVPAREVLVNSLTSETIRDRVKSLADDLGIQRSVRDPVLGSIRPGSYPDHSDTWVPFAYSSPATLWDYVSSNCPVIWCDELSCTQIWDEFFEEQKTLSEEAVKSGTIAPKVEDLYRWNPNLDQKVRQRSRLFFDQIELANLESIEPTQEGSKTLPEEPQVSSTHRVVVKTNSDLLRGARHSLGELEPQFRLWIKQGFKIIVLSSTQSQLERIRFLLEERMLPCQQSNEVTPSVVSLKIGSISEGFRWPAEGLVIISDGEILGTKHVKKNRKSSTTSDSSSGAKNWAGLQALSDLAVGDAVVHVDHGIGKYQGIVRLDLLGAPSDFLLLEYAQKDRLYLPVYRLNVIQKYVGAGETAPLDKLGSQQFAKTKEKVRDAVKKLAIDLIQLYAQRKIKPGIQFSPRDAAYQEFEAQFPYDETPDQLKAIDAVLADLESGRVMDRLVCGDVGYGKTEVAIRAAYKAVSDGKQVAVLVPTTILAQQHELSFKSRLKDYPIIIESISRFKNAKEQRSILEAVSQGKIDIVVGTHRLLSKDVNFHDLGLIIVDEEHRFGVEHKERLKTLKVNTHVLTLTATPIPRTLHMALSGLRDISLINTPPVDRLPIRTYVSKYDDSIVQRAITFELSRGGQVFYLHNRVQTIYQTANRVRELIPSAEVLVAHGQMPESELENTMTAFYQKKGSVLVCTTIIESGLDLPSANTILVSRADSLGLAQLYQIRGRVGRGQQRAYAYLFIPPEGAVTDDAKRRLEVIQRFVELGSGFSIASHDLEIRGGGDLLGPQQSGNIAAVGFDLYTELLEEAIQDLQGKPQSAEESVREPEIKTPFPSFLSESYVPDVHQRLSLYRRFSAAKNDTDVDAMEEEIRDRFGDLPMEAQNLLWLIRIKILLKNMGVETLTVGTEKVSLLPGAKSRLDPIRAIALISAYPKKYQLTPDSKLVVQMPTSSLRDLLFGLETLFKEFANSPQH